MLLMTGLGDQIVRELLYSLIGVFVVEEVDVAKYDRGMYLKKI